MNPRHLKRADLVNFTRNAAKAIAGGKVTGFSSEQTVALSTALAAEADALNIDNEKVVELLAAFRDRVELAQTRRLKILKMLSENKFAMRGVDAPDDQYEALGFDPPANPANRIKPKTPSKLQVTGQSNGVNKLTFKGNNVPGRVIYMVEANKGDGTGWLMIGSSKKQSFDHLGVKPGQGFQYRVRSQATRGQVSAWSNIAAVYEFEK
jgi:hypothetical protein